jgi:hypothetical protein
MAAALLDDLDRYLATVTAALADPDWDGALPDAPLLDAEIAATDRDAVVALIEAIGTAQRALRGRLERATAELDGMDARRTAARRYLQSEDFSQ